MKFTSDFSRAEQEKKKKNMHVFRPTASTSPRPTLFSQDQERLGCRGWRMAGIEVKLRGFLSPHLIFGLTIDSRSCGRGADSEPRRPVTNVISSQSGSLGVKRRAEAQTQKSHERCVWAPVVSKVAVLARHPRSLTFTLSPSIHERTLYRNCLSGFFFGLFFPPDRPL